MRAINKRLLHFFLTELIAINLVLSLRFLNLQSTITLLIFNFLFASLTFQLTGSFTRKLLMLAVGNFVGLFWNAVFYYFAIAGTSYFGKGFGGFYTITYPILNLLWIVPFWSLSLGLLPRMQIVNVEGKK